MKIELAIQLSGIKIASNVVLDVSVKRDKEKTLKLLFEVLSEVKKKHTLNELKNNPVVRAYRDFYWRIGIDPTKQRPSSEALLRRALSAGIPIINNVVDAGNIASIKTLIPIGLYDLDLIEGKLVLRFAKDGEKFEPIGGEIEELKSNQLVLSDEIGAIHVFPHRDSRRTMIRDKTKQVLILSCGVPNVESSLVRQACDEAAKYIVKLAGGSIMFEEAIIS
jgi:DNA/RNA-binding domain of Phe-tRNA-synthetase-like protein